MVSRSNRPFHDSSDQTSCSYLSHKPDLLCSPCSRHCCRHLTVLVLVLDLDKVLFLHPESISRRVFTPSVRHFVDFLKSATGRLIGPEFLAAKRSSTPALFFCLSVRLSVCPSVRLKTEFLTVWSAYDNL